MRKDTAHVLLIDGDSKFVKQVENLLQADEYQDYTLLWKASGDEAVKEAERNANIDIILVDYFLPDQTGPEVIRKLDELNIRTPVIVLTNNRDFDTVVEMMNVCAADYVVKDDIASANLPKLIRRLLAHHDREAELVTLETTKQRLEAMKDFLSTILREIEGPALKMKEGLDRWENMNLDEDHQKYVDIIKDNVQRIMSTIERLRTLKTDKTVKYIKDIDMIDLS